MKTRDMIRDIEQQIASVEVYRKRIWFDSCPPDVQAQLQEIKQRYKAGKYQSSRAQVAKAIAEAAGQHLAKPPSMDSVDRWLQR